MTASVGGPLAKSRVPKGVAGSKAKMLMSIFQRVPLQTNACVVYFAMPNKVSEAIGVLRSLQGDQQEAVARTILDYAAQDDEWQLTDEQVAEVQHRIANRNRQLFSVAQARKRLRHLDA